MNDELGGQTATVVEQVRGQHNSSRDGVRRPWDGCLFEWRENATEGRDDGREQTALVGDLYAPAGFRAAASDQFTVEPGPIGDDGAPARLSFDGPPQPQYDDEGVEDHVHAVGRLAAAPARPAASRSR